MLRAAAAVARALAAAGKPAQLAFTAPERNTFGLAMMEARPLARARSPPVRRTVIVLENDLYRRAPAAAVDALLGGARHVVVAGLSRNATSAKAELVLPAGTFAESDGTFVIDEGRAQRFFQVYVPEQAILGKLALAGRPRAGATWMA